MWHWFLAFFRLDMRIVCEMSSGLPLNCDFHDYPDDDLGPLHFHTLHCKRCGKGFTI